MTRGIAFAAGLVHCTSTATGAFAVSSATTFTTASAFRFPTASSISVTIQAASVTTGNAQRDGHLKTPDFFDIESYPTITFVSTDVERDGTDWNVTGDLTINATTKSQWNSIVVPMPTALPCTPATIGT